MHHLGYNQGIYVQVYLSLLNNVGSSKVNRMLDEFGISDEKSVSEQFLELVDSMFPEIISRSAKYDGYAPLNDLEEEIKSNKAEIDRLRRIVSSCKCHDFDYTKVE